MTETHDGINELHYDGPHWMVIWQEGGLIQGIQSCLAGDDLVIIEVDFDEIRGDVNFTEATQHVADRLVEMRRGMPPGVDRRDARLVIMDAYRSSHAYYRKESK